jgi:hypothetical protein
MCSHRDVVGGRARHFGSSVASAIAAVRQSVMQAGKRRGRYPGTEDHGVKSNTRPAEYCSDGCWPLR